MKSHHITSWMILAAARLKRLTFIRDMLAVSVSILSRRKTTALLFTTAILTFGSLNTLHASAGNLTQANGDYEYHYYGPVLPLVVMHADMTANFSNPDVMFGISIYGETFPFRLEVYNLRKAPSGDWWADNVVVDDNEYEFQNLGSDPFSWALLKAYAANGASSPGAWISCYFGYPPSTYRASTVALGANGIVSAGVMPHLHVQAGTSLTFDISASAPNNNCSHIWLDVTANQDESNWLYLGGNNSWQTIYQTTGTSGSFSYPINPSVRHYYFLARSMGDTISAPAIIHVEVEDIAPPSANDENIGYNTFWEPQTITGGAGTGTYEWQFCDGQGRLKSNNQTNDPTTGWTKVRGIPAYLWQGDRLGLSWCSPYDDTSYYFVVRKLGDGTYPASDPSSSPAILTVAGYNGAGNLLANIDYGLNAYDETIYCNQTFNLYTRNASGYLCLDNLMSFRKDDVPAYFYAIPGYPNSGQGTGFGSHNYNYGGFQYYIVDTRDGSTPCTPNRDDPGWTNGDVPWTPPGLGDYTIFYRQLGDGCRGLIDPSLCEFGGPNVNDRSGAYRQGVAGCG